MKRLGWEVPAAIVAVLMVAGPLLVGRGVDVPDDALYHSIASWEWLRYAWTHGLDPSFVPGTLGGVPLASDVVPMGPAYPASWLLRLFPVWFALPAVVLAHLVGVLFAVRWLAQSFGVGPRAATLAGAALAAGPLTAITVIDFHVDVLPIYLWFPLALGAAERSAAADEPEGRRRWALLAGAALALMLMGSHLRFSAAAAAAWGLWALMRRMHVGWIAAASVIGVCGGSPGFLPNLLALHEASSGMNRMVALSGPVHETFNGWSLTGWVVPKPYWMNRDFSLGTLLGLSFLAALPAAKGPLRRLGIFALLLLGAAVSPSVPGLRYLFAPLLLLSHPLDLVYGAIALFPAAVVAAGGLERLAEDGLPSRAPVAVGAVGLAIAARALAPEASFGDPTELRDWALGIGQAVVVGGAAAVILRRERAGPALPAALVLLLLADLAVLGVRYHLAVPSGDLQLRQRARGEDLEALRPSYVDLSDLAELQGFLYDEEETAEAPDESQRDAAAWVNHSLQQRRWPLHIGPGHGIPALSGRAKMPPRRSIAVLMPLSDALVREDGDRRVPLEDEDPARLEQLFAPASLGGRILRLTGTRVAVGTARRVGLVHDPLPDCWSPDEVVALGGSPDEALMEAWTRVVTDGLDPVARTFVEAPLAAPGAGNVAAVRCGEGRVEVDSATPGWVVLRHPWHRGWRLAGGASPAPELLPANAFHTAFVSPAGSHRYELRFVPPGRNVARGAGALAWVLVFAGLASPRRAGAADGAR